MSTCGHCGIVLPPNRAPGRARKWCSDRCRKLALYTRECVDCGTVINTGGDVARASTRCQPCNNKYVRAGSTAWVLQSIHDWADQHGGIPPAATDWNPAQARALGKPEKAEKFERDGCWPQSSLAQICFGSWNAAISAAGFEPRPAGHYGRDGELEEEIERTAQLYESGLTLQQVADELGLSGNGVRARLIRAGVDRRPWPRKAAA